jgi:general nucleoside transport system ATP-binding protein
MGNDPRAHRTLKSTPLSLHGITKRFGTFTALENVALSIESGRITALLGENGAGKTTLMRIAFGMIQPDAGSITVYGDQKRFGSPADAIAAGIGMVHQQFSLIPAMTVAENVALGGSGQFSFDETASLLRSVAERTGLTIDPSARVADLGSAERQKLEIIRTIAHDAHVMILDEPTAVLTPRDTGELFKQLRTFAASGGAVVLITHKLADALEHADDVSVLRRGRMVLSSPMSEANEASLVNAMLGETPHLVSARETKSPASSVVASLDRVTMRDKRSGKTVTVSIRIHSGEIIGISALDGAAIPLLRMLAGRTKALSGTVTLPARIGFVPENRREEALIEDFSLTENVALTDAGKARGLISWSAIENETRSVISRFDVRTPDTDTSPAKLSGGNQQRFVLGRELRNSPELLILENPTQGLDVNASAFVHEQIRHARSNAAAVVFYSSDPDELAELSDRVIVVSGDTLTEVPADRDAIGRALLGAESGR